MDEAEVIDVMSVKDGFNHVNVMGRVLEAWEKKAVDTAGGVRYVSEAIIGDSSGRIKVSIWGDKAVTLKRGEVVMLRNASAVSWHGEVQLSVGEFASVERRDDAEAPAPNAIPDQRPKVYRRPERFSRGRRRGQPSYGRRWKR